MKRVEITNRIIINFKIKVNIGRKSDFNCRFEDEKF